MVSRMLGRAGRKHPSISQSQQQTHGEQEAQPPTSPVSATVAWRAIEKRQARGLVGVPRLPELTCNVSLATVG